MHAVFMLYGKKESVEVFIRDMSAQKHRLTYRKEGEEDKLIWVDSQVRILPFGIYEYVFPKTDMDLALTTLKFHQKTPYDFDKKFMGFSPLKKAKELLKIEDIPEFKSDKAYIWLDANVAIIPLGVRYDGELVEPPNSIMPGWKHEAI